MVGDWRSSVEGNDEDESEQGDADLSQEIDGEIGVPASELATQVRRGAVHALVRHLDDRAGLRVAEIRRQQIDGRIVCGGSLAGGAHGRQACRSENRT